MCDPLTIAGIALSAASVGANSYAQSQVQSARKDAMAAERIRQTGYDKEVSALNATSQDRYTEFGDDAAAKSGELADFYKSNQVPEDTPAEVMPQSSSNVVTQEQAKQTGKAKAFTNQQADALGKLRAFGDVLGNDSRLQAREASQIGQIGGFKRGSSGVLSYELEDANNAGAGAKLFGDLLGGAGSLGLSAGLGGGTMNFGKPFAGAKAAGSASGVARTGGGIAAPLRFGSLY